MSKRNKEHIKKILREAGVENAPKNFTQQVMQDIFVSTSEEGLQDGKLKTLLKEPSLETPSITFVANVMKDIRAQQNLEYKPLISKKGWLIISTFFIEIIVFIFFKEGPQEPSAILAKIVPYLEQTKNMFDLPLTENQFFKAPQLSPILAISLFCLSSMLLFDMLLKRRLFT